MYHDSFTIYKSTSRKMSTMKQRDILKMINLKFCFFFVKKLKKAKKNVNTHYNSLCVDLMCTN